LSGDARIEPAGELRSQGPTRRPSHQENASALVARKVDVIAASGGDLAARAAKNDHLDDPNRLHERRRPG